ncbi:MAG: transcription-repair coupling factor [Candidatus Eisenbacteria bacterium]|nr:transcription-repair coupling factor [Candidatus Eisenbacteria bacterium]
MSETWLRDELAERLVAHADRLPEARDLLAFIEGRWGRNDGAILPRRVAVRGLSGSSRALLAAWLQRAASRPLLYVVAHGDAFEEAHDDVEYFRGGGATLAFPEPDNLPYDPAPAHPGITAQRLETLGRLESVREVGESWPGIVLCTVRGLMQRVPGPRRLAAAIVRVAVGTELDPQALLARLVELGYERLAEVEAVGHFARRGGIVDVWPASSADPLRLEFDGDTLVSLRRFDAGTQRSLEQLAAATLLPIFEIAASMLEELQRRHAGADWMGTVAESGEAGRYAQNLLVACAPAEPVQRSIERLKSQIAELGARAIEPVILCDNIGQKDRLWEMLGDAGVTLGVGLVSAGFTLAGAGFAVMTDHEIFARYRRRRRRLRKTGGLSIAELSSLKSGDFVVHEDHGVGIYRGMRRLTLSGQETDCLEISYAEQDRLFVPVQQLGLVSRYAAGEGARPSLHRLGSASWQKTKARAKKAIQDMAENLIQTYAARRALDGHAFHGDAVWQRELEASFPYEETPDQLRAIEEVKEDMESQRPMDRLICGDVGYGKTEVAIRAAFKAVQDGKQVAVLVPTTILAQQHLLTFRERLADFPVRVEVLSRFRTPKEQKQTLAALSRGEVDILIGTHRLLSKDVKFLHLGLVVIDEEHRFGVAQKEKIRQITKLVDVLAMTATPIPRTLNLSLAGARDMSVIETPPRDRLPVHTEILEYDDEVIADAVLREIDRGGQVFFVHNRVETIHNAALALQKLVPQVRVAIAHGQMHERDLEKTMLDFLDRRWDVLVSTMIVESGLDIPSVNTLIVDRADTLGLAQLYQLRGRVGRSSYRAYAYLLVPSRRVLTEEAEKRLRVIEEFDDLGVGFKIALKDMEIRGAGNMLGPEQHGFILGLGFDLYLKLLEEAVANLKGDAAETIPEPRLSTDWAAFLPEDYVPDEHEKLNLYRRLAEKRELAEIDDLTIEMIDRFGQLPPPAVALLELRRLRLLGAGAGVESLRVIQNVVELILRSPLKPNEIRALVGSLDFQVEFITGREFGLRVRGEGLMLLNRAREALEALSRSSAPAAGIRTT